MRRNKKEEVKWDTSLGESEQWKPQQWPVSLSVDIFLLFLKHDHTHDITDNINDTSKGGDTSWDTDAAIPITDNARRAPANPE